MKIGILETVKSHAGFELEFDRIIIETLKKAGHEPFLMIPAGAELDQDFHIPIIPLSGGEIVSYDGVTGLRKLWRSLQREYRRVSWFDAANEVAVQYALGAILLTTATYRYLRSLQKSSLRNSQVPIYFIFLGVNPQEMPKFLKQAKACLPYTNIHLCVTTLRDDFGAGRPDNVRLLPPPVMVPDGIRAKAKHTSLRIGFFGHYRKGEKRLDWLLRFLKDGTGKQPFQFVLQLAPTTAEDEAEVQSLVRQYQSDDRVKFITHALLGNDWYHAIQDVDAVFLPYTAERYLYNWSAIYFTAIGCHKAVLVTETLNPEVLRDFEIGCRINMDDYSKFSQEMRKFIDTYDIYREEYQQQLMQANKRYSKQAFIDNLLGLKLDGKIGRKSEIGG